MANKTLDMPENVTTTSSPVNVNNESFAYSILESCTEYAIIATDLAAKNYKPGMKEHIVSFTMNR